MKKNGFTLVELLATITILGIIALLLVPTVANTINDFKDDAVEKQKQSIVSAAKAWATDHRTSLPGDGESAICVSVSELKKGYIDKNLKNPKTDVAISDSTCVEIKKYKKTYTYTYIEK